jgi:hypothetical protein
VPPEHGVSSALMNPGDGRDTGRDQRCLPGWVLCGGLHDWDTCQNIPGMVQQANANGIQPILAAIRAVGLPRPQTARLLRALMVPRRATDASTRSTVGSSNMELSRDS